MNGTGVLFDRSELQDAIATGELLAWKQKRYTQFRETMRNSRYPCHFAVNAESNDAARYLFAWDGRDRGELLKVREGVRQYLDRYQSIADRTTLVMFFKPTSEKQTETEYRDQFWNVLEFLNRRDPNPWPSDVPTDPDHPEWEFCFAGEPMFIVGRAPFYTDRKSRYTPHGLEITIQPRSVPDDIGGETAEGQRARSITRSRLRAYDETAPHPDIGDDGDPTTREGKQYPLPISNETQLTEFPFEIETD